MAGNDTTPSYPEQSMRLTIMVVANDLTLLKLLDMALTLELACDVLPFASGRSAQETAKGIAPDLVILDELLVDPPAWKLTEQLHSIPGLERVPLLIINAATAMLSESQSYPLIVLRMRWNMQELYAAASQLLGGTT
jgi:response regulator RpfG family c-di-GMP phosphodiesterase